MKSSIHASVSVVVYAVGFNWKIAQLIGITECQWYVCRVPISFYKHVVIELIVGLFYADYVLSTCRVLEDKVLLFKIGSHITLLKSHHILYHLSKSCVCLVGVREHLMPKSLEIVAITQEKRRRAPFLIF